MIITKNRVMELPTLIEFHREEHKSLSISIIKKIGDRIDFKLKIQKASVQLLNPEPFAVIGLRRSKKDIFLEFYNEIEIDNNKIVKTLKGNNSFIINRVNITAERDIDTELIEYIVHSNELVN
jgi:hypothetical protein